jgi:hypothetical protein
MRHRHSIVILFFFPTVVVHQYDVTSADCGALRFSRFFSVRDSDRQDLRKTNAKIFVWFSNYRSL